MVVRLGPDHHIYIAKGQGLRREDAASKPRSERVYLSLQITSAYWAHLPPEVSN